MVTDRVDEEVILSEDPALPLVLRGGQNAEVIISIEQTEKYNRVMRQLTSTFFNLSLPSSYDEKKKKYAKIKSKYIINHWKYSLNPEPEEGYEWKEEWEGEHTTQFLKSNKKPIFIH